MPLSTNAKIAIAVGVTAAAILIGAKAIAQARRATPAETNSIVERALLVEYDSSLLRELQHRLSAAGDTKLAEVVRARADALEYGYAKEIRATIEATTAYAGGITAT
jgi:hypothetical protein